MLSPQQLDSSVLLMLSRDQAGSAALVAALYSLLIVNGM